MSDYEIVKNKGKYEIRHILGRHIYCSRYKRKLFARIHLFVLSFIKGITKFFTKSKRK